MLLFFITLYIILSVSFLIMLWSMLVVAKWDDTERGYDLLDGCN